jgi:hypothetical protein
MTDYPETHYKYSNLAQKVTGMPGCTVRLRYLANMLQNMDYGHTIAKSLIIGGPNSNPNPK